MTLNNNRLLSAAASVNNTLVSAVPAQLVRVTGYNAAGSTRYLKFYDKVTAPVAGTDTPIITLALPSGAIFSLDMDSYGFRKGLGFALTTGVADNDTGALTLADVLGLNVFYRD